MCCPETSTAVLPKFTKINKMKILYALTEYTLHSYAYITTINFLKHSRFQYQLESIHLIKKDFFSLLKKIFLVQDNMFLCVCWFIAADYLLIVLLIILVCAFTPLHMPTSELSQQPGHRAFAPFIVPNG